MKNIICYLLGHKYRLKRRITENISELICKRCHKEFGINCRVKSLLPMDDELRELHEGIITVQNIKENIRIKFNEQ